jgi:hypothetical protein
MVKEQEEMVERWEFGYKILRTIWSSQCVNISVWWILQIFITEMLCFWKPSTFGCHKVDGTHAHATEVSAVWWCHLITCWITRRALITCLSRTQWEPIPNWRVDVCSKIISQIVHDLHVLQLVPSSVTFY